MRPETSALLSITGVLIAAVVLGALTASFAVHLPGVSLIGVFIAAGLIFFVPYLASVRFSSPAAFDAEGRVWSFADGEIIPVRLWDTNFLAVSVSGYDAPKKLLSYDDVSGRQTTLLLAPARIVEEVSKRYIVVRGSLEKMTVYESRALLARPEMEPVKSALGISSATVYWCFGTKVQWMPPSRTKARIDFTKIGETLAVAATELASRGEIVEENWKRALGDMERIARKSPPVPPRIDLGPKDEEDRK